MDPSVALLLRGLDDRDLRAGVGQEPVFPTCGHLPLQRIRRPQRQQGRRGSRCGDHRRRELEGSEVLVGLVVQCRGLLEGVDRSHQDEPLQQDRVDRQGGPGHRVLPREAPAARAVRAGRRGPGPVLQELEPAVRVPRADRGLLPEGDRRLRRRPGVLRAAVGPPPVGRGRLRAELHGVPPHRAQGRLRPARRQRVPGLVRELVWDRLLPRLQDGEQLHGLRRSSRRQCHDARAAGISPKRTASLRVDRQHITGPGRNHRWGNGIPHNLAPTSYDP
mmetsp:Transcript_36465/g.102803  ORF Transcript_36465/g.102803 Transcript_36465/m.102803 type:complete len:276 (-) Transcript_36465:559-1386(-)